MNQGVEVVGLYVRDQDEALKFYVEKLGFRVPPTRGTATTAGSRCSTRSSRPSSWACHAAVTLLDSGDREDRARDRGEGCHAALVSSSTTAATRTTRCSPAGVEFTHEAMDRYGSVTPASAIRRGTGGR